MFLSSVALGIYYLNFLASNLEGDRVWDEYKTDFNKSYSASEELKRKEIFLENLATLRFHNTKLQVGLTTFKMGLNELSDMSFEEFKYMQDPNNGDMNRRFSFDKSYTLPEILQPSFYSIDKDLPENFDWREKIKITKVKSQGNCDACYAFAAVGAVESFITRKTGKVVELSVQEIIDCATPKYAYVNGCEGGSELSVLQYIIDNGLSYAKDYPFTENDGICRKNQTSRRYKANFTQLIQANSENHLKYLLYTYGPTVVSIDHLHETFMRYSGGIYYEPNCSTRTDRTSHSVLLVGYGSENGQDFWIVKNSFGDKWGEKGYFRIIRNKNNCLIASHAYSINDEPDDN